MCESNTNIMADLLACRVCLATDINLYNIYNYGLNTMFEDLTGITMPIESYPPYLCSYCQQLLIKSSTFKERCLTAIELLKRASMEIPVLTPEHIQTLSLSHSPPHSLSICSLPICTIDSSIVESPLDVPIKIEKVDIEFDEMKRAQHWDSDDEPLSKKVSKKKEKDYSEFEIGKHTASKKLEYSEFESDNLEKENSVDYSEFEMETDVCDTMDFESQKKKGSSKTALPDMEVVVLSKEEQIQEILDRKKSCNYQNSFYKCDLCFKGFMMESTYKNHMTRHDPELGQYSCEICHTRWPELRTLKTHLSTSHKMKYICKICNHVARSWHRAKEHTEYHRGHIYVCKVCGQSFAKSTSHLTHVRLHHKSQFACDMCGETFIGQLGLNMHKKKTHRMCQGIKPVSTYCATCKTKFKNIQAYKRHTSSFKDGVCDATLSACTTCGENCNTPELLKEHQKSHTEDAARCYECNRNFSTERSFAVHYQRVHLGALARPPRNNAQRRGKVPVVCEICGLKCISNATLVYHQRIHTGEKPFQCSECPKSFSVFQRLQIHIRTHTGERPFKCTHCPKAFKHKAALNRHDRVHTGVKPYQCPHCSKSFSQSNSMKLHVRTVHLKLPAPYRNRSHHKKTTE